MIEGMLIFCSDSVLRFQSMMDGDTAYPMTILQDVIGENDPYFLLNFFEHDTVIEQGTTLTNVFLALEPWAKMLQAYLGKNVEAYIKAVRKPAEVSNDAKEWLGIYHATEILRETSGRPASEFKSIRDFFNQKRTPTKRFRFESGFSACKFKIGDNERYSISGGLSDIKNLPIVLINEEAVAGFLGGKVSLFDKGIIGVHESEYGSFIVGDTDFSFREILVALFQKGLLFDTPEHADRVYEELTEVFSRIEQDKATEPDVKLEPIPNVPETANGNDAPRKVIVAPGAFNSVLDHFEIEKSVWERIKEKAKSVDGSPVRIGEIIEAKAPEVRIYGNLIEKE